MTKRRESMAASGCPQCNKDVGKEIEAALARGNGHLVNGGTFYSVCCPHCAYPIGVIDATGRASAKPKTNDEGKTQMAKRYVIEKRQADTLKAQIKNCEVRLISLERTLVCYEEGQVDCEGVKVTFEVYSSLAPDLTLTQVVPLPEHSSEMDGYADQVVQVAKTALAQRLELVASLLKNPLGQQS